LMDGVGTAKEMAGQVKAMFGFGGK